MSLTKGAYLLRASISSTGLEFILSILMMLLILCELLWGVGILSWAELSYAV